MELHPMQPPLVPLIRRWVGALRSVTTKTYLMKNRLRRFAVFAVVGLNFYKLILSKKFSELSSNRNSEF